MPTDAESTNISATTWRVLTIAAEASRTLSLFEIDGPFIAAGFCGSYNGVRRFRWMWSHVTEDAQ